jgi:hypothetical protein
MRGQEIVPNRNALVIRPLLPSRYFIAADAKGKVKDASVVPECGPAPLAFLFRFFTHVIPHKFMTYSMTGFCQR